jgi:hypothetical protein
MNPTSLQNEARDEAFSCSDSVYQRELSVAWMTCDVLNSLDPADHQVHRSFGHEEHAPHGPKAGSWIAFLSIRVPEDQRLTLVAVSEREEFA